MTTLNPCKNCGCAPKLAEGGKINRWFQICCPVCDTRSCAAADKYYCEAAWNDLVTPTLPASIPLPFVVEGAGYYRTRRGDKVYVVAVEETFDSPVIGYNTACLCASGGRDMETWQLNGCYYRTGVSDGDIVARWIEDDSLLTPEDL